MQVMQSTRLGAALLAAAGEADVSGPSYVVNMDGVISTLKRKTVHSVAVERYGLQSGRYNENQARKQRCPLAAVTGCIESA